jgi:phage terminase large subunit-like protein
MDWVAADEKWNLDDPDQCRAALRQMRGADITWSVEVRAREILSRKITRYRAKQLYLCQWTETSANSWLLEIPGVWEECAAKPDEQARPPDGDEVVVGVDMALRHDSVGVVVAGRLSDGRVGWAPYHWAPEGGRIDHLDVFATIAGPIAQRWKIRGVTYDPRFFEIPARLLEDQGIAAIEFPQSPERMCPADGLLFDALKDHQIVHPDDPVLNAHASNAAWREQERGRYLSKGLSAGHMDLIRAGSMATWELLAGDVPTEERGPRLW